MKVSEQLENIMSENVNYCVNKPKKIDARCEICDSFGGYINRSGWFCMCEKYLPKYKEKINETKG